MPTRPDELLLPWLVRAPSRGERREPDAGLVLAEAERLALAWGEVLSGPDLATVVEAPDPAAPDPATLDPAARVPPAWRGVPLAPLLRYKAMGYNAALFEWARRALRAADDADAALAVRPGFGWRPGRRALVSLAPRPGLFEHALAARLRERGGRLRLPFAPASPERRIRAAHPPRREVPGYVPFEVELDSPEALRSGEVRSGEVRPAAPERCDAIFLATMNNYLSPMGPTLARLRAEGRTCLVVVPRAARGWTNFAALPADVPRVFLEDLPAMFAKGGDPGPVAEAELRAGRELRARWERREAALAERHHVRGVPLWPFVSEDVRHVATTLAPRAAAFVELAARLLDATGARLLVVARLRRAVERAFHAVASRAGLRTAMLLHGHVGGGPDRRLDDGDFEGLDVVCLWLEEQRRRLLAGHEGLAPARLVVTGNPAWDGHIERATEETQREMRRALARRFDFPAEADGTGARPPLIVTLATQSIAREQFETIARVFAEPRIEPAPRLLVKVHPGESAGFYEAARERLPGASRKMLHVVPHGDVPLLDLLLGSDLLLTFSSTVNLESILLGTPVLTACLAPSLSREDRLVRLEELGFPAVGDAQSLRREIESCATDPARLRALRELTTRAARELHAGEAASRAARAILPT